jgi:hypothetical protein
MVSRRTRATYETFSKTLGDLCQFISEPGWGPVANAAYGVMRSVGTARLCPVASMRLKAYPPWKLCKLIERLLQECDVNTSAAVDQWLRNHKEEL